MRDRLTRLLAHPYVVITSLLLGGLTWLALALYL